MNKEGYKDPTAEKAVSAADRVPKYVKGVIYIVDSILGLVHMELIGIKLRDTETGRRYRWGE